MAAPSLWNSRQKEVGMELLHAPIPSLKGCWAGMRHLLGRGKEVDLARPDAEHPTRGGAVGPQGEQSITLRTWGAADCPELLLGECESPCILGDREEEPEVAAAAAPQLPRG